MRSTYAIALGAFLVAAPAMGQVIIQTPNGDATRHEEQAQQDRADATWHARRPNAAPRLATITGPPRRTAKHIGTGTTQGVRTTARKMNRVAYVIGR